MEGKERKEWVVAKLAGTGVVRWVELDTAFHPGNYPVVGSARGRRERMLMIA